MHSSRRNSQIARGHEDLSQKPQQPENEREHRGDEQQRDRNRRVEVEERAQEEHGDNRAHEQRRRRTRRNRRTDELGATNQRLEIGLERRDTIGRRLSPTTIQNLLGHSR